jgi:hypothetical protein
MAKIRIHGRKTEGGARVSRVVALIIQASDSGPSVDLAIFALPRACFLDDPAPFSITSINFQMVTQYLGKTALVGFVHSIICPALLYGSM